MACGTCGTPVSVLAGVVCIPATFAQLDASPCGHVYCAACGDAGRIDCALCRAVPVHRVTSAASACLGCGAPRSGSPHLLCARCTDQCVQEVLGLSETTGVVDVSFLLRYSHDCGYLFDSQHSAINPSVQNMHEIGRLAAQTGAARQYYPATASFIDWDRYKMYLIAKHRPGAIFSLCSSDLRAILNDSRFACNGHAEVAHRCFPVTVADTATRILRLAANRYSAVPADEVSLLSPPPAVVTRLLASCLVVVGRDVCIRPGKLPVLRKLADGAAA